MIAWVRKSRFGRVVVVGLAVVLLLTGALNVRSAFGGGKRAAWEADPSAPSAMDGLVGIDAASRNGSDLAGQILSLQEMLRDHPENGRAATQLGFAYLQQVREIGDPSYYPKAETLFTQALKRNDQDFDAMVGLGTLALARHDFGQALTWGERSREINSYHAPAYGVIGDAQIELGRYEDAIATFQAMVDLRPDLSSYARVSYARELMGDRAGAIVAMEQAAVAGAGRAENVAWTQVQLGNLHFDGGELDAAEAAYATALRTLPGYVYGLAGLGKVAAARGDFPTAITHYQDAIRTMPLPEFVISLGDILSISGDAAGAEQAYALVEAMQELYRTNGVDTDLEMALFAADHAERVTDLPAVVEQARDAYERRPSIKAADVLAWTLYQAGDLDGAWAASVEARRLGTQDALMRYHAGMIALARGDNATAATLLSEALTINPSFSVRYVPEARETLARISNS